MNRDDLIDSSDGGDLGDVLCRAERDYFKAGFRAGVKTCSFTFRYAIFKAIMTKQ